VTLIAGTSKRRSISTRVGSALSAALLDEVAVGVDDSLRRSLRKAFDLPVDDLDRTVDHAVAHAAFEDEFERLGEVEPLVLRVLLREDEIHEVPQLDRLGTGLV
jgi:hypothetical protein